MKDKKTPLRFWRLTFAMTLVAEDAYACGGAIQSDYETIQARENVIEKIELGGDLTHIVTFYDDKTAKAPLVLRLDKCLLSNFSMTYDEGMTEFWLQLEHANTDALHQFVKDYAFTRFFVEFIAVQRTIAEAIAESAADPNSPFQKLADQDGVSMSISIGDKTIAKFKPKGRKN